MELQSARSWCFTSRLGKRSSSMNKKILFWLLATVLLPAAQRAEAQPARVSRIGYVSGTYGPGNEGPYVEALRQGLRELGHVEGKTFLIEYRGAKGNSDAFPDLVNELVQLHVDILVLPTISAIRAGKLATRSIPIVMVAQVDPVETGLIDSLAHPGGNVTGLASLQRDLSGKRLELLKETAPKISRVGVLRHDDEPVSAMGFKEYGDAARALKIQLQSLGVRGTTPNVEDALKSAVREHVNGIVTITNNALFRNAKKITGLAIRDRLPSMFEGATWVESGGLMSYSANDIELFRRAAIFVDKILKGAKPVDLPVEQPTKFEFVINLKTATQIGLTIPPNVLARADKVIK